ncbi:MAG: nitroreductase family protein [Deltaproteobacteria bacterium]|nr:nitroreductase family protein [Deltaproteobacteria bacterium]
MDYNEIVEKRRAINFFDTQREVPDELLRKMIELAAKVPSSFNLQPWNLMVLKDPEAKKRLQALAWDQPKITEAPVVFLVLADRNGWQEEHPTLKKNWEEMIKAGQITPDRRKWFLSATKSLYGGTSDAAQAFAVKNTGFFAMGLMYAATSLGLDTHPMDGFDHEAVRKAFNIPENYWIPLLLAVGYLRPGIEVLPPKWRKSYDEIVVNF